MQAGSVPTHLHIVHGVQVCQPITPPLPPQTYTLSIPRLGGKVPCPVDGCTASMSTPLEMRKHFFWRHPRDTVCIEEEGSAPLPKCEFCGLQTTYSSLNGSHYTSRTCAEGIDGAVRRLQIWSEPGPHRSMSSLSTGPLWNRSGLSSTLVAFCPMTTMTGQRSLETSGRPAASGPWCAASLPATAQLRESLDFFLQGCRSICPVVWVRHVDSYGGHVRTVGVVPSWGSASSHWY